MLTYTYKLKPKAKRDGYLGDLIDRHNMLWNKFVWLEEVSRRRRGKHISGTVLNRYVNLHKKGKGWDYIIKGMNAQSIQADIQRREVAFEKFFKYVNARKAGVAVDRKQSQPKYKKLEGFGSFTLKQKGYKLYDGQISIGRHKAVGGPREIHRYQYFASRQIKGNVKTVTVKRDKSGDMWLYVVSDHTPLAPLPLTGEKRGFDFGSEHFFVDNTGETWDAPQILKSHFAELRKLDRRIGRCIKNSGNQKRLYAEKRRIEKKISDTREDWQWKMAQEMCRRFDVLCFEKLDLFGMLRRDRVREQEMTVSEKGKMRKWRRKLLDYAPSAFIEKVKWVAKKTGKTVLFCDRWDATSQKCSVCKHINTKVKDIKVRSWECPNCGTKHDRDVNAAKNVLHDCLESQKKKILKGTERCAGGASSVDVGQGGNPVRECRWARIRKSVKPSVVAADSAVDNHHGTQTHGDDMGSISPHISAVGGGQYFKKTLLEDRYEEKELKNNTA